MKLIKIGDNIAINIDRIDGIAKDANDPLKAIVYIGGNSDPFIIDCPMDAIIEYISKICKRREE